MVHIWQLVSHLTDHHCAMLLHMQGSSDQISCSRLDILTGGAK